MTEKETAAFEQFVSPLLGLPVSHVWRGYGSAIFLEFGSLHPTRLLSGKGGNDQGEMGLMIEWSWRIEGKRRIWCGSWSDDERLLPFLQRLLGRSVEAVATFGRLPEIDVSFSGGLHLLSMMTAEGDPQWALFDRRGTVQQSMSVRAGRLDIVPTEWPVGAHRGIK
jgi:hypothetical protein